MKSSVFPEPRKHIHKIGEYTSGKTSKDFNKKQHNSIKLSSNEASWGSSPYALNSLRRLANTINLYPESQPLELREAIAEFNKISSDNIVLGNGSNEIIQFILQAYINPGENIVVPDLTFSMYRIYAEISGIKVRTASVDDSFDISLDRLASKITSKTKALFIANPNNPTGLLLNKMNLELFLMGLNKDILVVIDEAYGDFCEDDLKPDFISMIKSGRHPNLIILKTFSKAFGLAGLRLGYGIACKTIANNLKKVSQPFNINTLAVIAGVDSLKKLSHYYRVIHQTSVGKKYLEAKLRESGISFLPTFANFIMIYVRDAKDVAAYLGNQGIIVRDLTSFGLDEYIRVTISNHEHNRQFISQLNDYYRKEEDV